MLTTFVCVFSILCNQSLFPHPMWGISILKNQQKTNTPNQRPTWTLYNKTYFSAIFFRIFLYFIPKTWQTPGATVSVIELLYLSPHHRLTGWFNSPDVIAGDCYLAKHRRCKTYSSFRLFIHFIKISLIEVFRFRLRGCFKSLYVYD